MTAPDRGATYQIALASTGSSTHDASYLRRGSARGGNPTFTEAMVNGEFAPLETAMGNPITDTDYSSEVTPLRVSVSSRTGGSSLEWVERHVRSSLAFRRSSARALYRGLPLDKSDPVSSARSFGECLAVLSHRHRSMDLRSSALSETSAKLRSRKDVRSAGPVDETQPGLGSRKKCPCETDFKNTNLVATPQRERRSHHHQRPR